MGCGAHSRRWGFHSRRWGFLLTRDACKDHPVLSQRHCSCVAAPVCRHKVMPFHAGTNYVMVSLCHGSHPRYYSCTLSVGAYTQPGGRRMCTHVTPRHSTTQSMYSETSCTHSYRCQRHHPIHVTLQRRCTEASAAQRSTQHSTDSSSIALT